MKRVLLTALVLITLASTLAQAQEDPKVPWRWGAHLGANINLSGVGYGVWITERGTESFIPFNLVDGTGLSVYGGISGQYNVLPFLAVQGRLSYDGRQTVALDSKTYDIDQQGNQVMRNDEIMFNTSLLNLEILAKLYIGRNFHISGGGGVGMKLTDTYSYRLSEQDPEIGDSTIPGSAIVGSFLGGLGYDIWLSDAQDDPQWILTPFAEVQWAAGMRSVDFEEQGGFDDALTIFTIRAGLSLAFGTPVYDKAPPPPVSRFFRVSPPQDGIYSTRVTYEYFPLRPFVFFDKGSQEVKSTWVDGSARYNNITKEERDALIEKARNTIMDAEHVSDADEQRYMQGQIYYNILNIVGYRMQQKPAANLTLTGSAPEEKDGQQLADVVKRYLVDVWEIDESRISTTGVVNPRIPSGTARTPAADRPMAEIENRRVELTSNDPEILRRAVVRAERPAREENEVFLEITTNEAISNWQATISGNGQRKSYGPFSGKAAYLDPTGLVNSDDPEGTFTVEVVATTADGRTLSDKADFDLRLNESDALAERHVLLFEYSEEDPDARSREFLDAVAPRVPNNSTVIISGFTDNIGNDDFNKNLSQERADMVNKMLLDRTKAEGKTVSTRAIGFGEDSDRHPYKNDRPEGRMYNRTVIIDIIP